MDSAVLVFQLSFIWYQTWPILEELKIWPADPKVWPLWLISLLIPKCFPTSKLTCKMFFELKLYKITGLLVILPIFHAYYVIYDMTSSFDLGWPWKSVCEFLGYMFLSVVIELFGVKCLLQLQMWAPYIPRDVIIGYYVITWPWMTLKLRMWIPCIHIYICCNSTFCSKRPPSWWNRAWL